MKNSTRTQIRTLQRRVAAAQLAFEQRSSDHCAGDRRAKSKGSGKFDFWGYAPWESGDRMTDIDWNRSALEWEEGKLVRRLHHDQKRVRTFVLPDINESNNFGSTVQTKRQKIAELTACVIDSAAKTHDPVGVTIFSRTRIEKSIACTTNMDLVRIPALVSILEMQPRHLDIGLKRAHARTPWRWLTDTLGITKRQLAVSKEDPRERNSGMAQALRALPRHTKCIVFVISDFMNFSAADRLAMTRARAYGHEVYPLVVVDPREESLDGVPGYGFYTLEGLGTGEQEELFVTPKVREDYAANFLKHLEELHVTFKRARCKATIARTNDLRSGNLRIMNLYAYHP